MCRKLFISVLVLFLTGAALGDLVGYWPLDGDGTDISGNDNHGTISGSVSATTDRNGNSNSAMSFAGGGGDKIDVGDASEFNITGAMTITAWVYLDSSSPVHGARNARILAKMGIGGSRSWSSGIEENIGGVPLPATFQVASNGSTVISLNDDSQIPLDQWVHYAGVYTPGTSMEVYLNGNLAISTTSGVPASQYSANSRAVLVGNRPDCGDCGWYGALDEVRIYNEALSEEEIEVIMGGYTAINPDPNDEALHVEPMSVLSWDAPPSAPSPLYDVYLGTDSNFTGEPPVSAGQSGISYTPDPDLQFVTTYYWRVDVNDAGQMHEGSVWSFTTQGLASEPVPNDEAINIDNNGTVLTWTGESAVVSYDVYFGTSQSAVTSGSRLVGDINGDGPVTYLDLKIFSEQWLSLPNTPSADLDGDGDINSADYVLFADNWLQPPDPVFKGTQISTTFDPGALDVNTTYYWRIDEVFPGEIPTGSVWSFTTSTTWPINIMPLGDSITQGHTTYDNYRHHLWDKLQSNGYSNLNFVGSHDVLAWDTYDSLVFDKDHEGHYGWHTDEIRDGGGVPEGGSGNLDSWLTGLQATDEVPDIVLMHLGTNDVVHNSFGYDHSITIGEMEDVIDILRSYNPDITILLAKIIPHQNGSLPSVDALNALIPDLDSYETATSEVIIVDHHSGFSTSWLADNYHPNTTGATEMSDRWYEALLPVLSPLPRVIVSTDIGGNDPDDFQSMVHYLVYADRFDTEGLIASPPYGGRVSDILATIDEYETDYSNLNSHASFPTPQSLRDVSKQGAINTSPSAGYSSATDGSNLIVTRANVTDPRPLWILVWGSITDVAQAVHDDPGIKSKIRVYSIGSWNTAQDVYARNYLYNNHSDMWWMENDSTFRGMYTGGDQSGDLGNWIFVSTHVRYHGALGDFFYAKKPDIKMGDTPSVLYLLNGNPDSPTTASWGGMFGTTGHGTYFWTDLTDPIYNESGYDGAKTVNVHREAYLRDWQTRMDWADAP